MPGGPGADAVQQGADPIPRQLLHVLADGGQPGQGVAGHGDAVEAHDRQVPGDLKPPVGQGTDGPQGHHIAHGEQGGKLRGAVQQGDGSPVAVPHRVAAGLILPRPVKGQSVAGKAVLTPRQPQGADAAPGGAAQNADLPVPQLRQVVDGLGGGGPVVNAQRGQPGVVQPPGGGGEQHGGHRHPAGTGPETGQVAPQKEDAQGLLLLTQAGGVGRFVLLPVQIVNGGVQALGMQ